VEGMALRRVRRTAAGAARTVSSTHREQHAPRAAPPDERER
jgi:hypothetical protein